MNEEKELERHNEVLKKIENAKVKEDLPNISFTTIATFLANNVYFDGIKISQTEFKPVVEKLIDYGFFAHPEVRKVFFEVIVKNYKNVTDNQIIEKYKLIIDSKKMIHIIEEIELKNKRLYKITENENLRLHQEIMKEINECFEIKNLPKVGLGELNKRLIKLVNQNDFNKNIKVGDIRHLTTAYLSNADFDTIEDIIISLCEKENLSSEDKLLMREQIIGSLLLDKTISYIIEEIQAKENRKLFIYKNDHELTMEAIKEAHRISQLPPNLTVSTLTGYLNGNTTIYPNDDRINSEDLKNLTDLLLKGYKWEDEIIIRELINITEKLYSDKSYAFKLLFDKLSKLPRTYYYVEEINYSLLRQKEFIENSCSNVNVYFIPNGKSPLDGGRFYNCYISRIQNLDLSKILPLNLDEIVPPQMDIDAIEWYVRQYYDDTFKKVGGIILNKDETIGNVNIFKPNDGKVGITIEEKKKMDEISDLDIKIQSKKEELVLLETDLNEKKEKSTMAESKLKQIINRYERKVLSLQMEMLKSIETIKEELNISDDSEKVKNLK